MQCFNNSNQGGMERETVPTQVSDEGAEWLNGRYRETSISFPSRPAAGGFSLPSTGLGADDAGDDLAMRENEKLKEKLMCTSCHGRERNVMCLECRCVSRCSVCLGSSAETCPNSRCPDCGVVGGFMRVILSGSSGNSETGSVVDEPS